MAKCCVCVGSIVSNCCVCVGRLLVTAVLVCRRCLQPLSYRAGVGQEGPRADAHGQAELQRAVTYYERCLDTRWNLRVKFCGRFEKFRLSAQESHIVAFMMPKGKSFSEYRSY